MQSDRVACALETKAASGSAWASMKALNLVLTLQFYSLRAPGHSRSVDCGVLDLHLAPGFAIGAGSAALRKSGSGFRRP